MSKKKFSAIKFGRSFLSFFLFLLITAYCLIGCMYVYMLNPIGISKALSTTQYTTSLYNDIVEYTEDLLEIENINKEYAKEIIRYSSIERINDSYVYGVLETSQQYGKNAFDSNIQNFDDELSSNFKIVLDEHNVEVNKSSKQSIEEFSDDVCNYVEQEVKIEKLGTLNKVLKYAKLILSALGVTIFVLIFIFIWVILSIGEKKHRSSRYISYAFFASSILDCVLIAGVKVIDYFKDLVLYPLYFRDAILVYVDKSLECVFVSAVITFLVGAAFGSLTWNLRSKGK